MFMKKTIIIGLLMITLVIVWVPPAKAQHQGNITINTDGTITPSTASIQQWNTVYTLTSDVAGSITIQASNIVLDGNGNTVSNILLQRTSNVTVKNFEVTMRDELAEKIGILLNNASNNIIFNNTVTGFWSIQAMNGIDYGGIYVIGGNLNAITKNYLNDNLDGMVFVNTTNNIITQNNIASNPYWSPYTSLIHFVGASNNVIYHNNFGISAYKVGVYNSTNFWDNGFPIGGNYWQDYTTKYPNAAQIDTSEIGNIAYVIDEENQDQYPLLKPFNSTLYTIKTAPPKIELITPSNQKYNESSVVVNFAVDKEFNWAGYSIDGKQNVTIPGNSTIADLTNGLHTLTVYANSTFGSVGASETINFTIAKPEPFPILTIAAIGVAVIVLAIVSITFLRKQRTVK